MKNIDTLTNTINTIIANGNTTMVEICTEPKMNKRNNPLYGRVKKHTAYCGVNFRTYSEVVNERRAEEGNTTDFVPNRSVYESINDFFCRKGEQIYFRLIFNKGIEIKSFYEVDNRPATEEEVEIIKSFLPSRKSSADHQGLSEENEVQMRVIKIENVVAIGHERYTEEVA